MAPSKTPGAAGPCSLPPGAVVVGRGPRGGPDHTAAEPASIHFSIVKNVQMPATSAPMRAHQRGQSVQVRLQQNVRHEVGRSRCRAYTVVL